MSSDSPQTREREPDDTLDDRSPKRAKLDESLSEVNVVAAATETAGVKEPENILPPSHVLLGIPEPLVAPDGSLYRISERDVGISEYISRDVAPISGIIKQRCAGYIATS